MHGDSSVCSENVKGKVSKSLHVKQWNLKGKCKSYFVYDSNFLESLQNITTHFFSLNPMFHSLYFLLTAVHIVSLCVTDVATLPDQTHNTVLRQFYCKVICQM